MRTRLPDIDDRDDRDDRDEPLPPEVSERSRAVALTLGLVGGFVGLHRFYAGRIHSGVIQIITLGGLGVWWLYDLVLLVTGEFRDAEELPIRRWGVEQGGDLGGATTAQVRQLTQEVEQMQRELGELAERLDFTERILAKQKQLPPPS